MYRKIENLETAAAQLRRELDELKQNAAAPANASAIPAGFPWALVIQILMAVLTYLIQHAVLPHDTQRLRELKSRLEPYQPVFQQKEEGNQ